MSTLTAVCSSQYGFIQTHGYGEDNVCISCSFSKWIPQKLDFLLISLSPW